MTDDKFLQSDPLPEVSGRRFYAVNRTGSGRYAIVDDVGILWTNDSDSTQLMQRRGDDRVRASKVAMILVELASSEVSASMAFDGVVQLLGVDLRVRTGDLSSLADLI